MLRVRPAREHTHEKLAARVFRRKIGYRRRYFFKLRNRRLVGVIDALYRRIKLLVFIIFDVGVYVAVGVTYGVYAVFMALFYIFFLRSRAELRAALSVYARVRDERVYSAFFKRLPLLVR